jgi:hypothetical protein
MGTCFDEVGDHLALRNSAPVARRGTAVGGVVERFGAPSITSANSRTVRDQRLFSFIRGRRDVQCRVPRYSRAGGARPDLDEPERRAGPGVPEKRGAQSPARCS